MTDEKIWGERPEVAVDVYSQRLGRESGLSAVTRQLLLHDVELTPLLARGDAGLMLGARF